MRVVGCARGTCSVLQAAGLVVAWCSLSSSVGGGLEPWPVRAPGCMRTCEQQGYQLPAVSPGAGGQASVGRFLWLDRPSLCACLCICLLGVGDLYESVV